ncbi:acetoacetate decarboxylase family protein [Pseudothauera nasutitermitis]|nr:acetoacetate decarboxylase family protein [Pseudothauera nasutitermitis]
MSFVKTIDEIESKKRESVDFFGAEMLTVAWETRPEIIERLLPAPLKPAAAPLAFAFIGWYPATNFGVTYHEAALFVRASYNGEEGNYCLSMPVDNDIAMAGGREVFGFPKKMATFHFAKEGARVQGWVERKGHRFVELSADLDAPFNDAEAMQQFMLSTSTADGKVRGLSYNVKHFITPDSSGFEFSPRLVRQETVIHPKALQVGKATVNLAFSLDDPWAEVEVVKILGAMYTVGDNAMLKGSVVAEIDPDNFRPHAFLKWDSDLMPC